MTHSAPTVEKTGCTYREQVAARGGGIGMGSSQDGEPGQNCNGQWQIPSGNGDGDSQ